MRAISGKLISGSQVQGDRLTLLIGQLRHRRTEQLQLLAHDGPLLRLERVRRAALFLLRQSMLVPVHIAAVVPGPVDHARRQQSS